MAVDQAIRENAENLFVYRGLTLKQVSQEIGVPERTIANWSSDNDWQKKRMEYRQARGEIKRYTILTQLNLIKDIHNKPEAQKIYAFESLVRASKAQQSEGGAIGQEIEQREINTPQDAVEALQEAIQSKINIMLSEPNTINLAGIKDMKKAMEMVDEMRTKYESGGKEIPKGISLETIEKIRRDVLRMADEG